MSIRIVSHQSHIVVVDVQERLAPLLDNVQSMLINSVKLLKAAQLFDIPITVAEQYPKGLGKTVKEIEPFIVDQVFEKTTFSCFGSLSFSKHLEKRRTDGRDTLVVVGCEAHVCVLQTVIDGMDAGYNVVVVNDAVASRNNTDVDLARSRLSNAGASYVSTEMLLFEWTQSKDAAQFKAISALVK